MGFLISISMLQVKNAWLRQYTISNWIYLVLLAAYLYILLVGPKLATERALAIQVAAQKIIVYASIVNLGYQALGIRRAAQEMGSEVAGGRTATDSSLLSR
jgi:Flp pilus assembly protein protease CpaA